ncbi:RNA pseudouridine synthase [Bacteriovorax stolpii]|uniref:RNA pseudouridine synthase n=1 Tax=Bacteriovorax stolpii TaxID=960 RepID=A0A2K9NRZ2_BACTC|nr:RNA pseudouridine synthase [Bacteriovorax stolpii]AUN98257.1 RNA pseudouridine synthase [Bacteriovorax stolpii]QDK41761.1 RNA pseudouridine synthase [Bacteriovorax stolpii]TDP52180.1 RNA pseudouridylate synthase [Bacteriovorax stolpii]
MSFYDIVLENEHFVIVDKKAMVLSVPGRMGEDDGRPVLGKILESDLKITIYPVHRLDFEVQGLIMYAKTPAAHKAGNAWFEKKEVHKTYAALTKPLPDARETFKVGESYNWKCKLLRGKKRAYEAPHGKESLTTAFLASVENGVFHWEMNPITGRSHQLRYELFRHGHPIIGDVLYSSSEEFSEKGIALRAFKIDFSKAPRASEFLLPEILEIKKF